MTESRDSTHALRRGGLPQNFQIHLRELITVICALAA